MTVRSPGRLTSGEGCELVRRALEDLAIAEDRDPGTGTSKADMARDLGVSRQHLGRLLDADQPQVNLRAGAILALRKRARDAVLGALCTAARALDAAADRRRAIDSRGRQLSILVGRHQELLERVLADAAVDPDEAAAVRASLRAIAAAAGDGCDDLATEEP